MTISVKGLNSGWKRLGKEVCLVSSLLLVGFAAQAPAAEFDLNALIEAAKGEKPITVYASTGKIKKAAAGAGVNRDRFTPAPARSRRQQPLSQKNTASKPLDRK